MHTPKIETRKPGCLVSGCVFLVASGHRGRHGAHSVRYVEGDMGSYIFMGISCMCAFLRGQAPVHTCTAALINKVAHTHSICTL